MFRRREKKKEPVSILIQSLDVDPRPGQPLFSFIVFFSIILDAIRIVLKAILTLLVILIASAIIICGIAYAVIKPQYDEYMQMAEETVSETTEDTFRYNETTVIYDRNGEKLDELSQDSDTLYLNYDEIPEDVVNAFIAVENRTFWDDPGVDFKSIVRVVYTAIITKGEDVSGASTITQQLARLCFLSSNVTLDRKFQEMALAVKLTEKYDKTQIMEFYVNNAYFANGYYGIEAAAQGYFGKSTSDLSLSEIAYLCAIPNSPAFYDPYNDETRAVERRDTILESMYDVGFISWSEMEEAKAEEIEITPEEVVSSGGYAVTYAADCAIRYFMELDGFEFQYHFSSDEDYETYTEEYNEEYENMRQELYKGGYRIYTSIDLDLQDDLQEILDTYILSLRTENSEDLQAAMVLTDESAQVLAVIGGVSSNTDYGLNRAYQSFRQPGSTIKPLIVYTPALENGYTADSVVKNISVSEALELEANRIATGETYEISEMSGSKVTLRYALEQSLNGVAYYLMDDLGVYSTLPYLEDMHFTHIVNEDYTMSAALGGLTYGVSTEEMAGAYACLANDGMYNQPTCIISIVDRYGEEMYERSGEEEIYTSVAANDMEDLLEGVMVSGTAKDLGWYNYTDVKAYVKTGTTDDQTNGWMCGWTDDGERIYTLAVWVGCDTPKALSGLWGSTWSGTLWMNSMLRALGSDSDDETEDTSEDSSAETEEIAVIDDESNMEMSDTEIENTLDETVESTEPLTDSIIQE